MPAYEWDTPLRVVGGLHHLVLSGRASWDDVPGALERERTFLRRFVAEQGVQTNEVQRSWMLVPCFLEAARLAGVDAVDLVELGPSAGLNLVWDRYHCVYRNGTVGPADAPLELRGDERRAVPPDVLAQRLGVRSRVGVDRAPIDLTSDEGVRLLKAFVWPDQTWRLDGIDRAVEALRADPPRLVRGDLVDELPRLLGQRREDALLLVFQTAVLGYLPAERRRQARELLAEAGSQGKLALVEATQPRSGSHDHYAMVVQVWPGGRRREVALADFHGSWIEWLA